MGCYTKTRMRNEKLEMRKWKQKWKWRMCILQSSDNGDTQDSVLNYRKEMMYE